MKKKKPMWLLLHPKNIFCIPEAKMTDKEIEHVSKNNNSNREHVPNKFWMTSSKTQINYYHVLQRQESILTNIILQI